MGRAVFVFGARATGGRVAQHYNPSYIGATDEEVETFSAPCRRAANGECTREAVPFESSHATTLS